jgi:hypothetical protein
VGLTVFFGIPGLSTKHFVEVNEDLRDTLGVELVDGKVLRIDYRVRSHISNWESIFDSNPILRNSNHGCNDPSGTKRRIDNSNRESMLHPSQLFLKGAEKDDSFTPSAKRSGPSAVFLCYLMVAR